MSIQKYYVDGKIYEISDNELYIDNDEIEKLNKPRLIIDNYEAYFRFDYFIMVYNYLFDNRYESIEYDYYQKIADTPECLSLQLNQFKNNLHPEPDHVWEFIERATDYCEYVRAQQNELGKGWNRKAKNANN